MNQNPTLAELQGEVARSQAFLSQRLLVAEEKGDPDAERLRKEWDELRLYGDILDERRDARVRYRQGDFVLGAPGRGPIYDDEREKWMNPDLESLIEEFEYLRVWNGVNAVDGADYYMDGWQQAMLVLRKLRRRKARAKHWAKIKERNEQLYPLS